MPINNYIKWPAERIRQDENNRFVTDIQVAKWDGKADSDHNHDDKYIPLTGTARFNTIMIPKASGDGMIGGQEYPIGNIFTKGLHITDGSKEIIQI